MSIKISTGLMFLDVLRCIGNKPTLTRAQTYQYLVVNLNRLKGVKREVRRETSLSSSNQEDEETKYGAKMGKK